MSNEIDDSYDDETTWLLEEALAGDRYSAINLWSSIAKGHMGPDERIWVQHVAQRIVEADRAKGQQRALEMLNATGLQGRLDRYKLVKQDLDMFFSFPQVKKAKRKRKGLKAIFEIFLKDRMGMEPDSLDGRSLRGRLIREVRQKRRLRGK